MQLKVKINTDGSLVLPIAYNYIIQSAIYNSLSIDEELSDNLHNGGYSIDNKTFKLFTFDKLFGEFVIEDGSIRFIDDVLLEIRSINPSIIFTLKESFDNFGINLMGIQYECETSIIDRQIFDSVITIKMLTPITVYKQDKEIGRTIYLSPLDEEFYTLINSNIKEKYYSFFNEECEDIYIKLLKINEKDKVVVKYKGNYINGYKGLYRIKGNPKVIDFLYNVGLGAKNSSGFGMFKICS